MILAYVAQLGPRICSTIVNAQQIDKSLLNTFEMLITSSQIIDRLSRARFL